ncbi:MAG: hypothetical protein JST00_29545 [Deltaproteobacteria bacterium]|nr:hypothetical protein [Deltaproteobacteria bacterium]
MRPPFRDVPLRARAIELLKQGHHADQLHWHFVNAGEDPEEVRAVLTELVALQHEAAAMDPARLRHEATNMFLRGASVDDVVAHFVRVGVAEAHARPEAERIRAAAAKLKSCARCGTWSDAADMRMDLSGFMICRGCNLRDEIQRSEQRGFARELEGVGGFGIGGLAIATVATAMAANATATANNVGQTHRPFCPRCAGPTGIHVSALAPQWRARAPAGAEWVCRQCGTAIA